MIRLALIALLIAFALVAFDGTDAAPRKKDAASASSGAIRFTGAVMTPAGAHAPDDMQSVASLPPGQIIRRGSPDPRKRGPLRTVVLLPPRKSGLRVVLITFD
ncbi:MAG TPA: hypothetical protein VHA71_02705 [Rhodanobacteraceae bacterium]|jgi:hypothetical protein|nr:hypothetical protein [Rhodanobacteraceae bacterium]